MTNRLYDIIAIGDFREPVCQSTTAIDQLQAAASYGYRVGIVQLKTALTDQPASLHKDLQRLVAERAVTLLDPDLAASAKLLLATDPRLFMHLPRRVVQLEARLRVVMVREAPIDRAGEALYDWTTIHRHAIDIMGGPVTFAPQHGTIRRQIADLDPGARMTDENWPDILDSRPWRQKREGFCSTKPVIGRHGAPSPEVWPMDAATLLAAYPDHRDMTIRLSGCGDVLKTVIRPFPQSWDILPEQGVAPVDFLAGLDFFVYTEHARKVGMAERSILEALASGAVTILPPSLEPAFGDAAVYAALDEIEATVWRLYADRKAYTQQSRLGAQRVAERFSPSSLIDRLLVLIGSPDKEGVTTKADGRPVQPPPTRSKRRVLFITINGVGMGHLTRMLAIAKRCPDPIEPVFLTMSQALKVVREQGFLAEYVPSRKYLDCDLVRWNGYLRDEINEVIAFYDPAAILFDGNVPYQGVIDAITANPDPWSIWSRRGMWRAGNATILERENFFDAVLEPGDLAEEYDHGMTTQYRSRSRRVMPIRLLDQREMLPRGEARRELGLNPEKPAVLIQLGAGNNFDYRTIHKTAYTHVTEQYQADVAVGEWLISDKPMDLPANVVKLPGYPFARYFNAFDLAISAVGYNSFHELIYAGVPTILVPNEAMEQDNQLARALYADRHGLAKCVRAKEIYGFIKSIDEMFDPDRRRKMQQQLDKIEPANGAAEAAAFIEEIVYSRRVDL